MPHSPQVSILNGSVRLIQIRSRQVTVSRVLKVGVASTGIFENRKGTGYVCITTHPRHYPRLLFAPAGNVLLESTLNSSAGNFSICLSKMPPDIRSFFGGKTAAPIREKEPKKDDDPKKQRSSKKFRLLEYVHAC